MVYEVTFLSRTYVNATKSRWERYKNDPVLLGKKKVFLLINPNKVIKKCLMHDCEVDSSLKITYCIFRNVQVGSKQVKSVSKDSSGKDIKLTLYLFHVYFNVPQGTDFMTLKNIHAENLRISRRICVRGGQHSV